MAASLQHCSQEDRHEKEQGVLLRQYYLNTARAGAKTDELWSADGPKSIIQASWNRSSFGHFAPVMSEVYATRGVSGLYAGFGPAMIRAFPANAALFLGYEMTRSVLAPL